MDEDIYTNSELSESGISSLKRKKIKKMTSYHWILMIFLVLITGSMFLVIKLAETTVPPLALVSLRSGIGTIIIGIYCLFEYTREKEKISKKWKKMLRKKLIVLKMLAFALFKSVIPFLVLAYSYQFGISSGVASVINAFVPIIAALIEMFLRGKK
eukprot:TRINITY_DN8588_c0_g1_i1.p2 TRINITY_DN8588_c0_g1~~TRINITY_DN8588_c0_g1_i1.p2  ORF type:complete len:156 (-),score=38.20 TRINITY_DN8588_c0_g1_i1:563-1030(-)